MRVPSPLAREAGEWEREGPNAERWEGEGGGDTFDPVLRAVEAAFGIFDELQVDVSRLELGRARDDTELGGFVDLDLNRLDLRSRVRRPVPIALGEAVDRKSTRLNSSHIPLSRMPSS